VVTWLTYAGFYLYRKNIGVVLPLLEHDLGYSNTQLAHVIFGYSLFYTVGQLCCGVLSDRFGPRRIVGIGLFLVVISNLVTGFITSLMMLGLLACLNGLGQSAGRPGLVKNMSYWFGRRERGVVMAWWGTNYVMGGFLATIFATFVATNPMFFPSWGGDVDFGHPPSFSCSSPSALFLWSGISHRMSASPTSMRTTTRCYTKLVASFTVIGSPDPLHRDTS
jgi:sugar phosphate permease